MLEWRGIAPAPRAARDFVAKGVHHGEFECRTDGEGIGRIQGRSI
jgi:hypothetical protein